MSNNSSSSNGISFASALGLLFIGLKLAGVIQWSWLWVLSPFWIGLAILIPVCLIVLALSGAAKFFNNVRRNRAFNRSLRKY